MNLDKPFVIYDRRVRWVAVVNMTFVVVGVSLALRFESGFFLYLLVGFLVIFSLFWIRDLFFGFKLKLLSDGLILHWQDGKVIGSVPLVEIQKVLIGTKTTQIGDSILGWTHVRFQLSSGVEQALPPNIASGLRSRSWRHLKQLMAHLRTVSHVPVEPINEPGIDIQGWKDELHSTANTISLQH